MLLQLTSKTMISGLKHPLPKQFLTQSLSFSVYGRLSRSITLNPTTMNKIILRANPAPDDDTWVFVYSPASLKSRPPKPSIVYGKLVSLSADGIALQTEQFPMNRILNSDDPTKFVLLSVDRGFRFTEQPMRVAVEYIVRIFKRGLWLNGVQYRFYGHSNSQLVRNSLIILILPDSWILEREVVLPPGGEFR